MSSYKVSEPSALKFLKANGAVVDENGNVINDASDYWKKVYDRQNQKLLNIFTPMVQSMKIQAVAEVVLTWKITRKFQLHKMEQSKLLQLKAKTE